MHIDTKSNNRQNGAWCIFLFNSILLCARRMRCMRRGPRVLSLFHQLLNAPEAPPSPPPGRRPPPYLPNRAPQATTSLTGPPQVTTSAVAQLFPPTVAVTLSDTGSSSNCNLNPDQGTPASPLQLPLQLPGSPSTTTCTTTLLLPTASPSPAAPSKLFSMYYALIIHANLLNTNPTPGFLTLALIQSVTLVNLTTVNVTDHMALATELLSSSLELEPSMTGANPGP